MDIYIKNLAKIAGKGFTIAENPKSIKLRDKNNFLYLIEVLDKIDDRALKLESIGINLMAWEDPYIEVIEGLLIEIYGPLGTGIILWWCSERKLTPSKTYNLIDEAGNSNMISDVNGLYKFILNYKINK